MKDVKKPVKFVPCDEDSQVYSWQRTYKKAAYKPYQVNEKVQKELNQLKKYRNDKRKQ
jgi:hypothetical protein